MEFRTIDKVQPPANHSARKKSARRQSDALAFAWCKLPARILRSDSRARVRAAAWESALLVPEAAQFPPRFDRLAPITQDNR